jgi:hypothetical protein
LPTDSSTLSLHSQFLALLFVKPSRDRDAVFFFNRLERAIETHGVSDASGFPVRGFPYLRTNRFLAAMKESALGSDSAFYWAEQMLKLDLASRRKEIANLPDEAFKEIFGATDGAVDRDTIYQKTETYALQMFHDDRALPDFLDRLRKAVSVPAEYSSMARIFGFYPLAGIPVTIGTAMAYSRYEGWHRTSLKDFVDDGQLVRFFPEEPGSAVDPAFVERLFDSRNLDAFGLPVLTQAEEKLLAYRFAPIIHQDLVRDYDRIGRIQWRDNLVRVDPGQPSAYFYVSYTFLDGRPVLQLNYVFWYSERAGPNAPWMERGPLDGLSYRVTLNGGGKPVMADIMNNCGCYYFFVPRKDIVAKIVTKPGEIAPLVPTWLPEAFPDRPINLRVNSGWHQVQKVFTDDVSSTGIQYALVPYETLESLPKGEGRSESVFSPAGIMKNSWRIEPMIFFSMGIPDIGYMRQRGHHAIKMVGRMHFTDPDLYDGSFLFKDVVEKP